MMKLLTHKVLYLLIATLVISVASSGNLFAAEKDKSARRAALMMQKMKQDMEAEKTAMQAQFDTQKKELEDKLKIKDEEFLILDKKLVTAVRKNKNLESEIEKVNAEKAAVETKQQQTQAQLEITQKNLADLNVQHQQAQIDLKFNDNQRKTLSTSLAQTTKSVNECEAKNAKLHQFGIELIQIYDKPSSYEAAMRKEQFFQLKRVALENILQDKQNKLDEARFLNKKSAY
jgi:septal ring factor EnvC (AmiA/AmiB activator)